MEVFFITNLIGEIMMNSFKYNYSLIAKFKYSFINISN